MKRALTKCVAFFLGIGIVYGANEINSVMTFKVVKGYLTYERSVNLTTSLTSREPNSDGGMKNLTSNWVNLATGVVSTNGWAFFRNLNTNGVHCQLSTTNDGTAIWARLEPGEFAFLKLDPSTTLYGRANATTTVNVVLERAVFDK